MSALPPAGADDAFFVVDLHCWMHRFFRTMGGRCAHGFIEMMGKLIRQQRPAYLAVATDLPFPTFRATLYPKRAGTSEGYKAHRDPPDPTLLERIRWAKEMVVDVFGIPVFSKKGFEADDVIAALHGAVRARDMRFVVIGLDKDLAQLCDEKTVLWDGKNEVTGIPEVIAKFGVRPDQLRDYLAIVGDTADNIPGVKGMGPKAAAELLQAYGSLEEALREALDSELKSKGLFRERPRYREMLIAHQAEAELSIQLATLATDTHLTHTIEECRREE